MKTKVLSLIVISLVIVAFDARAQGGTWVTQGADSYTLGNVAIGFTPAANTAFFISKNGLLLYGTAKYNARISNGSADRGVLLGYDDSVAGGVVAASGTPSSLMFATHNGTAFFERMRIDSSGNVGIGTTTPGATNPSGITFNSNSRLLEIKNGTASDYVGLFLRRNDNAVGLDITSDGATAGIVYMDSRWAQPSSGGFWFRTQTAGTPVNAIRILGNGNVGIGSDNPAAELQVERVSTDAQVIVKTQGITKFAYERFMIPANSTTNNNVAAGLLLQEGDGTNVPGNRLWSVGFNPVSDKFTIAGGDAAVSPRISISPDGKVGIGTSTPQYTLDVSGNAHFSGTVTGGNIRANYQDVAEWVPSAEELEPGTVVVLRAGRENEVAASREAYDTKVAGVVSVHPGVLLGQGGAGKEMIATTGRVRVRVDATKHAIEVGDLLVTSDVRGAAMFSEPVEVAGVKIHRPGTIIGKALEPLERGNGRVLVLLSLQ